jgi:hypothetical protein
MNRCPSCGAHNPERARWCSQCLRRFEAERSGRAGSGVASPAASPPGEHAGNAEEFPAVPPVPGAPGEAQAGGGGPRRTGVDTGAFVTDGDQVRWQCPACEALNDIDVLVCATCGTPLAAAEQRRVDWDDARRRAVLGPGLGHLAAGRGLAGWARLILAGVWLLGALALLATAGAAALASAAPLLVGVAVLWIGSVADVDRLARGGEELFSPRVLLWIVVGVLVAMLLTLLVRAPTPSL